MLVFVSIFLAALRETLFVYFLNLIWAGRIILQNFDQHCIWIMGVLIALVLTIVLSLRNLQIVHPDVQATKRDVSFIQNRIRFWRTEVNLMSSDVFSRSSHPSDLRRLVILVLANQAHVDIKEINKRIRYRKLQVPPEVSYVLGMETPQEEGRKQPGIIYQFMNSILRKWRSSRVSSDSPDPRFGRVAAYLESLLENDHDS
jgi:hypothetical protein